MGHSRRSFYRWYNMFLSCGNVKNHLSIRKKSRWPRPVIEYIETYTRTNPAFYLDELQDLIREKFPDVTNISNSTICRVLVHDLKLTRKIMEKRAREASPIEATDYMNRLDPFYSYPGQLVFIDETSKDARDAVRKFGRSRKGNKCIINVPHGRGTRISALASFGTEGFLSWKMTQGTFTRARFHEAFLEKIAPLLNPWPMPHSIVIMDNAKIHMYPEIEELIHSCGSLLFYLPPYCPFLNPIEVGFGLVKKWLSRNGNYALRHAPEATLNCSFINCTKGVEMNYVSVENLFLHCGYGLHGLIENIFNIEKINAIEENEDDDILDYIDFEF